MNILWEGEPARAGAAAAPVRSPRPWWGPFQPVWWGMRALRNELWGFRFSYPTESVAEAAAGTSLQYHVYSERLFFDVMELDANGVPIQRGRVFGKAYNPSYVAWYGLVRLQRALRGQDLDGHAAFERQIEWLAANAVRRPDGAVVWTYDFDWIEGPCVLRAPWISAMAQGLAMSALVRAHRITGKAHLLELAGGASRVFATDIEAGGVRTIEQGAVLYEEYPAFPAPRVLDGFLFSLLGLYDLFIESADPAVFRFFAQGVDGLAQTLPFWNFRDKWSWYGARRYLCPPHYNALNRALLESLARVSGNHTLDEYARTWDPRRLTPLQRGEIFVAFLVTKNRSRFAHYLARPRLEREARLLETASRGVR